MGFITVIAKTQDGHVLIIHIYIHIITKYHDDNNDSQVNYNVFCSVTFAFIFTGYCPLILRRFSQFDLTKWRVGNVGVVPDECFHT